MKALIVTPYYHPKIGGLENYARQLSLALRLQEDWEIVVATSNHLSKKQSIDVVDDMKVYRLGTMFKFSNTPLNPLWPLQLRSILRREKPDVIIAHMPVPSMADAVALAAGKTPLVITYHAATLLKGESKVFNTVARLYGVYERITLCKARKIFAVSEYVKESLGSRYSHKTVVIPNAVWNKEIITRVQPSETNFLFIGSLDKTHSWKGLDDIITALSIYKQRYHQEARLTIMGDGNYRQHYENMVAQYGLENDVVFTGAKIGNEKDDIIRAASALISYPTTANDAFPTVLLEAWAKSVPVIAAAIGPLPSLVQDSQDGFLVKPRDPAALATALHKVVMYDDTALRDIVDTAAERTKQKYTWERQAKDVARIVGELL